MKDAHDILVDYGIKSMGQQIIAFEVERLLKNTQKEAYNQAIDDAAENVKLFWTNLEQTEQGIDIDSILKLRKV